MYEGNGASDHEKINGERLAAKGCVCYPCRPQTIHTTVANAR